MEVHARDVSSSQRKDPRADVVNAFHGSQAPRQRDGVCQAAADPFARGGAERRRSEQGAGRGKIRAVLDPLNVRAVGEVLNLEKLQALSWPEACERGYE